MVATYHPQNEAKPVTQDGLGALGFVTVVDRPLYDNGVFYVIDTVKDLQFAVYGPGGVIRAGVLNKYEAIEWADDFKAAWERNPPIEEMI